MRIIFIYIKIYLCSCGTNLENCLRNISVWLNSISSMIVNFQGCHIYGILGYFKSNKNPDQKVMSDSSYLWLKTLKSVICFSAFPNKACQGRHISEGARTILIKIIVVKWKNICDSCHASVVTGNSM